MPVWAGRPQRSDDADRLTVLGGLSGLSLDAIASVSYGPEAMVLVLAAGGVAGLGLSVPVTLAISIVLIVLVLSYRQVIAAFPEGGGAYAVARRCIGRRTAWVAAASLITDYVLNVAVSIAAGVAALTSAFPPLLPYTPELCLVVLAGIMGVNLRGIATSARTFMLPTALFVFAVVTVVVVGLIRREPAWVPAIATEPAQPTAAVGVLLVLRAFANGCASLTGVEAIANAVPSFRAPSVRRAQRTEVLLGMLLGTILIGLALLIQKFGIHPVPGMTILAQLSAASLGQGLPFYGVQVATTILLALAANTSFGGFPVLTQILAHDNSLPHLFALRARRQVYRYGVLVLTGAGGLLLVVAQGRMNTLVPLFAVAVFVGFTIAQYGMVRYWLTHRRIRWRAKAALNGLGAALTGVASIVTLFGKFTAGAWIIAVALPTLVALFWKVSRSYQAIENRLHSGWAPPLADARSSVIIVPVGKVSELSRSALQAALSLNDRVVAVHVSYTDEPQARARFQEAWQQWHPGIELVIADAPDRDLATPVIRLIREDFAQEEVFVLIAESDPDRWWARLLVNNRAGTLERRLRRGTDAVVCRMRFPIPMRPNVADRLR